MHLAVTDRFHAKQGRSTGRWIMQADGRRLAVYLKRHYRLPWWRGLLALLWPGGAWSPAVQEWRNLRWAQGQGLPVPRPVAVGEWIGPGLGLQSFLAVEELTGMLPLHEAIPNAASHLDATRFAHWKRGLTAEVARLSRELHRRRWFHKDLYLCHFYVSPANGEMPPNWRGQVHLIDLHRLSHHRWTALLWRIKDLAQLLYSSEVVGVTARDRLRFWRLYLGPDRQRRSSRWLRRIIVLKWRRYRQHNLKRRKKEGRTP
jgi:heptose I phosphotransferase